MNDKTKDEDKKISKHEFYFETPLYTIIKNEILEENIFEGDVDAFVSGFDTTFNISKNNIDSYGKPILFNPYPAALSVIHEKWSHNIIFVTLKCVRKKIVKLRFFIYQDEEKTIKIGQHPSLADIQFSEIDRKYNKFLSKEEIKEFKRAIGLVAHGTGVGSFVYLRRIFENLIYNEFNKHEKDVDIIKKDFSKKRMEEKVEILKEYLPSHLIEMKTLYSILSKGIHKLSEEECLKYFSILKLAIELILDQKIEIEKKEKKDKEVKKQLQIIKQKIK